MIKRKISAILLAWATLSCACPGGELRGGTLPSEVSVDQDAAGSTVKLHRGQRLLVTLPGNPTTGFVWQLVPGAESVLIPQGEPSFTTASAKLGAGGVYRFSFLALEPGSVPLRFSYQRSFAQEGAPARSFEITVVVDKGASD